jgi:uncharacterized protein (DUF302 family)
VKHRAIRFGAAAVIAAALAIHAGHSLHAESQTKTLDGDGIVKVKSAYGVDETVTRLKQDIADKGIAYFLTVDQSKLAADAGITVRPSTLLIFGNPPLGTQFISSNSNAGLDWPVRLLVTQDGAGTVWAVYTDFAWIKRRHGIADRDQQFDMATKVIQSITSSVVAK